MKVLKARPVWHETYDNMPSLEILVDSVPSHNDLRYEQRDCLFFAELDGYVSFYYYERPGDGFGGREFRLTIKDGSQKLLRGPWSSNPATMNAAGFTPSADVSFTECPAVWERGHTFYSGHITAALFKMACEATGLFCVEQDHSFYPSLLPCGVVKLWTPYNSKRAVGRWMPPSGKELVSKDMSAAQNTVIGL